MALTHHLIDLYRFPGFVPQPHVEVHSLAMEVAALRAVVRKLSEKK